jgi:N-acetylmuramoyl-L-alanine amidase
VILLEGARREVTPVARGAVEMVPLAQVVEGLGIHVQSDPAGGAVTLSYLGRQAVLYHKRSLASIGGELRLLSAPPLLEEGRWLVPADGVPRFLAPLLGRRVDWRAAQRVLVVGNVSVPRVTLTTYASGDVVRVVLEASEKVPFKVFQEETRVTVQVPHDLIEVAFAQERLTGGIVEQLQYLGGKDNVFAATLGKRFQQVKAFEQEVPRRLVLEFMAAPLPVRAEKPAPPPAAAAPAEPVGVRTVVIDPGHGGEEVGAKGPGGTLEKDVTLNIARKLRATLTNSLGLQVFLTRDKDQEVPLDDRTAIANNYKADVFISIHANASRAHGAKGSEVYFLSYQASDDEARRTALMEGAAAPLPETDGGSELAFILWDMAQAEHLEESSALASRIQEEMAEVTGSEGRGIKQAPFRVLVGAAMPAVLVELAFISNPDEEKLLASEPFQNKLVAALARGVSRYQTERARRTGITRAERPGS